MGCFNFHYKFMITYEILEYFPNSLCHRVRDEKGVVRLVDIMVNGDFPEDTKPESLIGQKIQCDYEYPDVTIAVRARIVKPDDAAS